MKEQKTLLMLLSQGYENTFNEFEGQPVYYNKKLNKHLVYNAKEDKIIM